MLVWLMSNQLNKTHKMISFELKDVKVLKIKKLKTEWSKRQDGKKVFDCEAHLKELASKKHKNKKRVFAENLLSNGMFPLSVVKGKKDDKTENYNADLYIMRCNNLEFVVSEKWHDLFAYMLTTDMRDCSEVVFDYVSNCMVVKFKVGKLSGSLHVLINERDVIDRVGLGNVNKHIRLSRKKETEENSEVVKPFGVKFEECDNKEK